MKIQYTREAPETLWESLDLALEDLQAIEQDDRYVVDMRTWHEAFHNKCYVCLAGATLSRNSDLPPTEDLRHDDLSPSWDTVMDNINNLRRFRLPYPYGTEEHEEALSEIEIKYNYPTYEWSREKWYDAMYEVRDYLKENGI